MLIALFSRGARDWAFTAAAISLFSLVLGTTIAVGQEKNPGDQKGAATNQTTVITAGRLSFDYDKRYGVLEDNVHVAGTDMIIDADKITLRFREDNQVSFIVAIGNVSIKQGDGVATCSTARCDVVRGEMILTGNPELARGKERMAGEKITIEREPGKKGGVRVRCDGVPGKPTTLILGPGAKLDMQLTDDKNKR